MLLYSLFYAAQFLSIGVYRPSSKWSFIITQSVPYLRISGLHGSRSGGVDHLSCSSTLVISASEPLILWSIFITAYCLMMSVTWL